MRRDPGFPAFICSRARPESATQRGANAVAGSEPRAARCLARYPARFSTGGPEEGSRAGQGRAGCQGVRVSAYRGRETLMQEPPAVAARSSRVGAGAGAGKQWAGVWRRNWEVSGCGCVVVWWWWWEKWWEKPTQPTPPEPVQIFAHKAAAFHSLPFHPIPSHPPPTPIAQPASRGKASACHGLEQLTSSCPRCSLLNSIGPGPEHSALLPCCPAARPPSLLLSLKTRNLLSTLAEPHSPSALARPPEPSVRLMTRPALPAIIMSTLS